MVLQGWIINKNMLSIGISTTFTPGHFFDFLQNWVLNKEMLSIWIRTTLSLNILAIFFTLPFFLLRPWLCLSEGQYFFTRRRHISDLVDLLIQILWQVGNSKINNKLPACSACYSYETWCNLENLKPYKLMLLFVFLLQTSIGHSS